MPHISVASLIPQGSLWQFFTPLLDRVLGLSALDHAYITHGCAGLAPTEFAERALQALEVQCPNAAQILSKIPKEGPVLILANHPFGGIEGILLIAMLSRHRPDIKILANRWLSTVPELRPMFIAINPFQPAALGNASALRDCHRHLKDNGLLTLFPAGRVSYYQNPPGAISDHPWHRVAGQLAKTSQTTVLTLFISGHNSKMFYRLGRISPKFRLLMLTRELLKSRGRRIHLAATVASCSPPAESIEQQTKLYRLLCYLQDPSYRQCWPKPAEALRPQPLANRCEARQLDQEIGKLPDQQILLRQNHYLVIYAQGPQIPLALKEICRLREKTFRTMDEGSGQPLDGDHYDHTYTQLFIYDQKACTIVGAYRMGQTDLLLYQGGLNTLYLDQVFEFEQGFPNRNKPCLEMGRSFIAPDYQRSFFALLLLFRGIGAFLCRHPQYRILYGTVSLSRQYDPLSVYLIQQWLAHSSPRVSARHEFCHPKNPELTRYLAERPLEERSLSELEWLVKQIESDDKGLPILLKQYHQMGAQFHSLGVDPNFAATPGLLLSVDMDQVPEKLLKRYLLEGWQKYQNRN